MSRKFRHDIYAILTVILLAIYCMHSSSCANTRGAPSGGPKDTIPPVVLKTVPDPSSTNFPRTKGEIVVSFNEYVTLKNANNNIILSPPQNKRPKTKIKGKSIVVTFEEPLDSATTYSLNFGNAIQDNNEGNPLPFYTFTFSTGDTIDSLMLSGNVYNYSTLLPVENATVGLYYQAEDSTVFNKLPNAVTKTDKWGYFVLRNLKKLPYSVYAIKDENNNNKYDPGLEAIGFLDSLITPDSVMRAGMPQLMIYDMKDTLECLSRPSQIDIMVFSETPTKQYIKEYKRVSERDAYIKFGAPNVQIDSFSISGIKKDRIIQQFNETNDSLCFWIKDGTTVDDSLFVGIKYMKYDDSLRMLVPTVENLKFILPKTYRLQQKEKEKNMRNSSGQKERKDLLKFKLTATPETMDMDGFKFEFPEPLISFTIDSLKFSYKNPKQQTFKCDFTFIQDSTDIRKFVLMPKEEFKKGNEYELIIPQHTFKDIYNFTNDSTYLKVSLPSDDKLSSITVDLQNVNARYIVELVNETRTNIFRKYIVTESKKLLFPYLREGKYSIRITEDLNSNGRLDIGDVLLRKQPEKVILYKLPSGEETIELKERTDLEQTIDLKVLFKK